MAEPVCKKRKHNNAHEQHPSIIDALPLDLLLDIIVHVASSSPSPLADLASMKTTSKQLCYAAKDQQVLAHIALEKYWGRWFPREYYDSFLTSCAKAGNPEANFIIGMMEPSLFNMIYSLEKAMRAGHMEATYMLALLYFSQEGSRTTGIELFNKLASDYPVNESGSPLIQHCRERVKDFGGLRWHGFHLNNIERQAERSCRDPRCGKIIRMGPNGLWEPKKIVRRLCSPLCAWTYELNVFCDGI